MIDFNNLSLLDSWVLDVILILISASACFYCAMLSRRLKRLNRLDVGVGASIVSLTDAIGKTHDAAREAQSSTQQTVETLRFLLEKSESMAPVLEASLAEVTRSLKSAQAVRKELDTRVTPDLMEASAQARKLATGLLQTVKVLETRYNSRDTAVSAASTSSTPAPKAPKLAAADDTAEVRAAQTSGTNVAILPIQSGNYNLKVVM